MKFSLIITHDGILCLLFSPHELCLIKKIQMELRSQFYLDKESKYKGKKIFVAHKFFYLNSVPGVIHESRQSSVANLDIGRHI